jgi:uncharacterized protein (DUF1800 family)
VHPSTPSPSSRRRLLPAVFRAALIFLGLDVAVGAVPIDQNATKQIWKLKYGVSDAQIGSATWLNQDSDGDGLTNEAEISAGTNPFNGAAILRITNIAVGAATVDLTFAAEKGKQYVLQAAPALTSAFTNTGVVWLGTGATTTQTVPKGSNKFFRVLVQDLDTDGDGLSDWAELALGLNPNSPQTIPGVDDLAYVNAQGALSNQVTIAATAPFVAEDGATPGRVTITRTQNLFPLIVNYTVSGTAVPGTDYVALNGSVSFIARGATSIDIPITPIARPQLQGGRSVTVSLTAPPAAAEFPVTLGVPSQATVIINDSTVPAGNGLLGRYYDTASTTYSRPENFGAVSTYTYTRATTTTGTATIAYSGTPALAVGNQVNVAFTTGQLNNALYSPLLYPVTAVTPGVSFTVAITGTSLPTSQAAPVACQISITSFPHPAVLTRVDPTVNFDWQYGTPNGVVITPNNSADNYSATWDGYLQPATAGSYTFQLDADDKARVLLDTGSGLVQILEHGWDGPATVGTFKQSAPIALAVPATPGQRYHIRVEHVETTGDARCRLQWKLGNGAYANIPQASQFTHTQVATYTFTRANATTGTATVTLAGHGLANGNPVTVAFSAGNLFTPNASDPNGYSGIFTVANATANTFDVTIAGTNLPANQTSTSCFLENRPASTTTGVFNRIYPNTAFSGAPGRVGVDASVTTGNNGIWGAGTPDGSLIGPDTFSVRWTGQVQPQFSEEYTFVVQADDGCTLWLNGQPQVLRMAPSANTGGFTYTYDSATGDVVVTYSNSVVVAGAYVVGETVRLDPAAGNLSHAPTNAPTYSYDASTGLAVVDYTNLVTGQPGGTRTPGSYAVGESVELDPTSGPTSALSNLPYPITAAAGNTFTVNFGTGVYVTGTGSVTIADTRNAIVTAATPTTFTVNVGAGKYATTASSNMNVDIVSKPLKDWSANGNERYVRLPMIGGVRYDIRLDYYENTSAARCLLSWYSPSQPKQIIPAERLYPGTGANQAPPSFVSPTDAIALVGGPFSYVVAGSNGGTVTVTGNPAWLTYVGGILGGTPPAGSAGDYQILLTVANSAGTSISVLNLHVDENAGNVPREYWNGIAGISVASIPTGTTPSGTDLLTSLAAPTNFGDNYGARIRGYITAPTTGNYYFWIAGSNAAELWISNDSEPVNALKRAWVTTGSATPQTWNAESNQKSPWLALVAGKKYYVEILHKAGTGAGDSLAVGWLKPGETGAAPSEVVPGYTLSPYVAPAPGSIPGTLYVATMLAQPGAVTNGVGSSTLRVSEDGTTAIMRYSYSGLTGPIADQHIHSDPYLTHPSSIIFDIDDPVTAGDGLQLDGSYKWTIQAVGGLSAAEIVELIREGKAYINLHTAAYPAGEIRGNYTLANGSRTFTPPPAPPAWADDHTTNNGAVRFLTQATFGANIADITALKSMASYEAWIDDQFAKPATPHLAEVLTAELADVFGAFDTKLSFNTWWKIAMTGPDQLRQRVAFALSEIHVVSGQGPLEDNARALSHFYDTLAANAFGNFRDILAGTTLTPGMGRYLDMLGNDKPDISVGRSPNENYAREIQQLFSIGLYRMWPDGSLVLDSSESPVPTYTQREVVGFAHTFTGWYYGYSGGFLPSFSAPADWTRPMREVPARHFTGPKRLLNNEVLPGLPTVGGQPLDPYATHISSQYNDPAYQALPAQELNAAHDQLFNHPNAGPFICRQLIQRLVTSNPSRDYLYRVVQKFNDDGTGTRGNMKVVIKAILLDYEARSSSQITIPAFGKQREPVVRIAQAARALRPANVSGSYAQSGTNTITITTSTPHLLAAGNSVFLEFSDTTGDPLKPAPTSGAYTVLATPAPTPTTYSVNAPGWMTGTYSQTGTTITVTMNGHWLPAGGQAYFDFTSGPANGVAGFDNSTLTVATSTAVDFPSGVGNVAGTTFTLTAPFSASATGQTVMISRFSGSYSSTGRAGSITIDTTFGGTGTYGAMADHNLSAGDNVFLNFTNSRDTTSGNVTSTENDIVYPIVRVPDLNTFVVTARDAANAAINSDNQVFIFPLKAQPLIRNGTVNARPSTFALDNTDPDISQTPLNSTTVFNFFLPDYKFAGTLASQGITTPEFQLTAETTVVRQANFLYNGIFNPNNTTGISSFKTGTNALVLDLSPWMGNATDSGLGAGPQPAQVWTSNANLGTLIDRLNTLLVAGQLPAAAKSVIQNFVGGQIASISVGNPATVTMPAAHGLKTGDAITITGVTGGTFTGGSINATFTITANSPTTFTIPLNCTSVSGLNLSNSNAGIVPYTNATPSATNIRDRLRAITHLILTSPDYTIQR